MDNPATDASTALSTSKSFETEYLREMRNQTQMLSKFHLYLSLRLFLFQCISFLFVSGRILTELKKNNHYVKRLMKEGTIVKKETHIDLVSFCCS